MYIKFAQITDLHLDEELPLSNGIKTRDRLDKILKDIENENITTIVCTGDISENNGIAYFFEKTKTVNLLITPGNHDSFSDISKYYSIGAHFDALKLYHSVQKKYYKFIYLDSSDGVIDQQQLQWFTKALFSETPILIFIHHPIIGLQLKVDDIGALKNRKTILNVLENISNEVTIFCGHYHMESNITYKNVKQHITPAIAFQVKKKRHKIEIDTATFGYRIIEITEKEVLSSVKIFNDAN